MFLALLCLFGCAAFALSLLPASTKITLHTTGRLHLLLHFGLFLLLGALAILSSPNTRLRFLLLALALLLGFAIEFAESWHFGNLFEPWDLITDIYGVLFGALICHVLSRKTR